MRLSGPAAVTHGFVGREAACNILHGAGTGHHILVLEIERPPTIEDGQGREAIAQARNQDGKWRRNASVPAVHHERRVNKQAKEGRRGPGG